MDSRTPKSPDEIRRRLQARDVLTSVLPRSRGQSPARSESSPASEKIQANSGGSGLQFPEVRAMNRVRSDSPIIGAGGEVTIPGEDEFKQMYDQVKSRDDESAEGPSNLVAAFSKVSDPVRPSPAELDGLEPGNGDVLATPSGERAASDAPNIERASARSESDFISLFSKPGTRTHSEEHDFADKASEDRNEGSRAMGRRRRFRTAGNRTKRQGEPSQGSEENSDKPAQVSKVYQPAYIQPVIDASKRSGGSTNDLAEILQQQRGSNHGLTTGISEPSARRPARRGFVKRQHARRGDNRLSSSTSGESSDEETSVAGADKAGSRVPSDKASTAVSDNEPANSSGSRPRRQRRARNQAKAQQVPRFSHTPDYVASRVRNSQQPAPKQASEYAHRQAGRRKQYPEAEVDKYSTLPENFRQSFDQSHTTPASVLPAFSTSTEQSKPYAVRAAVSKPLESTDVNILPSRRELMISNRQTSASLEERAAKAARVVATAAVVPPSSANQSQAKQAPSSAVVVQNSKPKVDLHVTAPGRRASVDKSASQLPLNKPTIGALRSIFNTQDSPKTDFGQVYIGGKKQASPGGFRSSSSRKSSVSEPPTPPIATEVTPAVVVVAQNAPEVQEVVYRQPMIEARKVAESYWPRDEDTEKLLNRNYTGAKSPPILEQSTLIAANVSQGNMNKANSFEVGHPLDLNAVGSPKETNLNDGDQAFFNSMYHNAVDGKPVSEKFPKGSSQLLPQEGTSSTQQPAALVNGNSESQKQLAWNFEDPDSKLKQFDVTKVEEQFSPGRKVALINDIAESLRDITIDGKPIYQGPKFEKPLETPKHVIPPEKTMVDITKIPTSSRKSSVVSQSTALPRKSIVSQTTVESAEIDEGCFTEEEPVFRSHKINSSQPELDFDAVVRTINKSEELNNRRARLHSDGGQVSSGTTSVSNGGQSSRSLSDPLPHGDEVISVAEQLLAQKTLKGQTIINSPTDTLSTYSENLSLQDFEEVSSIGNELSEQKRVQVAKVIKKKSLSDPIAKAVEKAGKMGVNGMQSPVNEGSTLCTSSSEPNLSEQTDGLGELNGFKKLNGRIDPRNMLTKAVSTPGIIMDLDTTATAIQEALRSDSSNRSSLAEKSDGMDHVVENEEKQFQQVLDSFSSQAENGKVPVCHTRSCSAPVDNLDNNLLQQASQRVRRPGIIQVPSMTDVRSNLVSAKQFSSSVDEIHAATLPRTAGSRGIEYQDTRKLVLKNLMDTEGSYVKSLQILHEKYMLPLKRPENHSLCDPRHVDIIFFQIPEILQHHQKFYAKVRQCYADWDPHSTKIGELFIASFNQDKLMESYISYINNYLNAKETVTYATQAKSSFRAFLEQCERDNREKQRLSDLMIQPVQRIPRYELIIKDLLKHTTDNHPDRASLVKAQGEIHALSVKMNKGEREAEAADRHARMLQEIEQIVENCLDIGGITKRRFLRQEICIELKSGNKKDRCLWLFNDLLMCTTVKKGRTGSLRRSSVNLFASSVQSDRIMVDFTSKYKFLWKFPLEDVELLKGSTNTNRQCIEKQLQHLYRDQEILTSIEKLTGELSCHHLGLDESIRELMFHTSQRISEKQSLPPLPNIAIPGRMEIGISTPEGIKTFLFEFLSEDRKTQFETLFNNARTNSTSQKGRWDPSFLKAIPVSKTRNGMQFSCAVANTDTYTGTKDIWVCNTDEYVGQICFLTVIDGEPCQTHCVAVCSSKICCITQVPAWNRLVPTNAFLNEFSKAPLGHVPDRRPSTNSNPARNIIAWDDTTDDSDEDNTSPFSTHSNYSGASKSPYSTNASISNYGDRARLGAPEIGWPHFSSSDDEMLRPIVSPLLSSPLMKRHFGFSRSSNSIAYSEMSNNSTDTTIMSETGSVARAPQSNPFGSGGGAWKKGSDGSTVHGSLEDLLQADNNSAASKSLASHGSMWMGTDDGKINVYSTIGSQQEPKSLVQLNHNASVQCILYHEGQVFVALSNGDLVIYSRSKTTGQWNFDSKKVVALGTSPNPITKMLVVGEKDLWCGCQNQVIIVDMKSHNRKSFFSVSQDVKRQIYCMVSCGYGVWVALDRKAHIKLYHTVTHEFIADLDVAQPAGKMLASSDAIIRQHKAACLRVTSLLVCKDLLWVGTSAGVVLTLALPSITASTNSLPLPIMPVGLPYGHTGHVRFLTSIEVVEKETPPTRVYSRRPSLPKRRSSSTCAIPQQSRTTTLVISGGDGYEDFRMNSGSEATAGRVDSTNHMLVWKV